MKSQLDAQALITAIVVGVICALIVASLLISYLANSFSHWPAG